jgi:hypothetical protein
MGALLAISSILGLLFVKHVAVAKAAGGSTAGAAGNLSITGAPDPNMAYDTKAPSQGSPIGNTHLSIADPVYSAGGDIVGLPYRPSDVEYGGGISQLAGVEQDPAPSGSVGSGISAIEKLNAPHAGARINGGLTGRTFVADFLPRIPLFRRNPAKPGPSPRAGDSGAGKLAIVPSSIAGIPQRHPVAPLRPTFEIAHTGVASTALQLSAAGNLPSSQPRPAGTVTPKPGPAIRSQIAGRRQWSV